MATDADLNAGIIDQDEAKARRALVSQNQTSTAPWTVLQNSCAATLLPES